MNITTTNEEIELRKDEADRNILWERYKFWSLEIIDYFKITMQFSIWFYAITGAITAFILNKQSPGNLQIAFLLPGLMGSLSGCAYVYFAWRLQFNNDELERLAIKIFTYTNKERKIIQNISNKEEHQSKTFQEKFVAAIKEAKQNYAIDGNYSFHTAHHLQTTLVILGITHILIGTFSFYLYSGITVSLFAFFSALLICGALIWRSDIAYKKSMSSNDFSQKNISSN